MKSLFELIMISEYYDIPLGVFFVVFSKKNKLLNCLMKWLKFKK